MFSLSLPYCIKSISSDILKLIFSINYTLVTENNCLSNDFIKHTKPLYHRKTAKLAVTISLQMHFQSQSSLLYATICYDGASHAENTDSNITPALLLAFHVKRLQHNFILLYVPYFFTRRTSVVLFTNFCHSFFVN